MTKGRYEDVTDVDLKEMYDIESERHRVARRAAESHPDSRKARAGRHGSMRARAAESHAKKLKGPVGDEYRAARASTRSIRAEMNKRSRAKWKEQP